jgi:ketosteroid isomerase-like protein
MKAVRRTVAPILATALAILVLPLQLTAQNLSEDEQEAWSALETQLAHVYAREWDKNQEYMHPDLVTWGPDNPVPYPVTESGKALWQTEVSRSGNVLGYEMAPVSVVVDGDVAIINFYVRHLVEETAGGKVEWVTWRGHNTWKKRGDRWLLLATYNTTLPSGG